MSQGDPLLAARGLSVEFETSSGALRAVRDVSFEVHPGETLGLIGESGCGKSTVMLALAGLLPRRVGRVVGGEAWWKGRDLLALPEPARREVRGKEIGLVFQDPQTALHPTLPVLDQVAEAFLAHRPDLSLDEGRGRASMALERSGIPPSAARDRPWAHQWSGGMRQRALIAMALAHEPELLIADEPTTALDVTVQAEILDLLRGVSGERGLLIITHDLGVIAELADRVAVMYAGRIVETGTVERVFDRARHPYTLGLLASRPGVSGRRAARLGGRPPDPRALPPGCPFHPRCSRTRGREACRTELPELEPTGAGGPAALAACHFAEERPRPGFSGTAVEPERAGAARTVDPVPAFRVAGGADVPAIEASDLTSVYEARRGRSAVRAVVDVGLSVSRGEILGLVGESGCGKSTLARTLVGLKAPVSGSVRVAGEDFLDPDRGIEPDRHARRRIQLVFQDLYASLNPRRTVGEALAVALRIQGRFASRGGWSAVHGLLEEVGLSPARADAYPHELSGGQRQRISIARALAVEPDAVVLDEPLTALDVALQAQILALLARLRAERELAMILIAHDLTVVEEVADRVAVMYLGRIVETGSARRIFHAPSHPYTRALLSAVPASHPRERRLSRRLGLRGEVPDAARVPPGCAFHPRCWKASDVCRRDVPRLEPNGSDTASACHHPETGTVNGRTTTQDRRR